MRKVTLWIVALGMAGMLFAQPPAGARPGRAPGPDFEKMQVVLELTDEQVAQWKALHESFRAQEDARREAWRQEREASFAAHQESLKGVFTESQWTRFEALRPEKPAGMEGQPGKNFNGPCKQKGSGSCCMHGSWGGQE